MNRPIAAPAGMIDSQFGVTSIRQLPPLTVVELTSTFDPATGYSWSELRLDTATGLFTAPTLPLTGNLAFDVTGNTDLPVGTRCLLAVDRDQTGYDLLATLNSACADGLTQGCAPLFESGSGSGSGDGYCGDSILTASVACSAGARQLTAKNIDLAVEDGRLKIVECSTETFSLGPCDPGNPDGVWLPVVVAVCPVYSEQCVTDCDSNPVTIRYVSAVKNLRRLVKIPVALPGFSCLIPDEADCCGSGSGSGSGSACSEPQCAVTCGQCLLGSPSWRVSYDPDGPEGAFTGLCFVDGWNCLWVDADGGFRYTLSFDSDADVWVFEDLVTGDVWVTPAGEWDCLPPPGAFNVMVSSGALPDLRLYPGDDCDGPYDCVSGTCVQTPGGPYATLAACEVVCGDVAPPIENPDACLTAFLSQNGLTSLPSTLYINFLDGWTTVAGTCGTLLRIPVTYNGTVWASAETSGGQPRGLIECDDDGFGNKYLVTRYRDGSGCGDAAPLTLTPGYADGDPILGTADINLLGNAVPPCECRGTATATVSLS